MESLLIMLLWVFNLGISFWNAYAAGTVWAETKAAGGWNRAMAWAAAVMSAAGFTWCILIAVFLGLGAIHVLSAHWVMIGLEMGFVVLAPSIVASGFMIMVDSWARAYREGGVLNYGVAAYNTYAQIHNTMSVVSSFGDALGDVISAFSFGGGSSNSSSSSDDDASGIIAVVVGFIVLVCACAGIALTATIIKKVSASQPLLSKAEMEKKSGVSLTKK